MISDYNKMLIKLEYLGVTEKMLEDAYDAAKEDDEDCYRDFCNTWISENFFICNFASWGVTKQGIKFWNAVEQRLNMIILVWDGLNNCLSILDLKDKLLEDIKVKVGA